MAENFFSRVCVCVCVCARVCVCVLCVGEWMGVRARARVCVGRREGGMGEHR